MGSTTYTDIQVFSHGVCADRTILVFSKRYENNVYPHVASWACDFIGSESLFCGDFTDEFRYFWDDGLNHGMAPNGNGIRQLLLDALYAAAPLTLPALQEMGFGAYSWSRSEREYLPIGRALLVCEICDTERWAGLLETESDVDTFVEEANAIRASMSETTNKRTQRVWLARPEAMSMSDYQAHLAALTPNRDNVVFLA